MAPTSLTLDGLADLFAPGKRVYLPGAAGESTPVLDLIAQRKPAAHFLGVWIPGINRFAFDGLDAESIFPLGPDVRLRPLGYRRAWHWLAEDARIDIALVHVSPPDEAGRCSMGVACDFGNAAARRAAKLIGIVNSNMPASRGGGAFMRDSFDAVVEIDHPLIEVPPPRIDETAAAIARIVSGLIEDGDTIEYGLGKIPEACIAALGSHRNLKLHSGMITEGLWPLLEQGVFERAVAGIALGRSDFYRKVARDPRCRFAPVCETHDAAAIGAIPNFKGINSAIEVDLLGQVNAETVGGRAVSGVGGLHDFMSGACLSRGGRGIIALPATAQGAAVSRIVARLEPTTPVTVARHHVQTVVTEFGVADLRGLHARARANALIAIAAPQFRDELSRSIS